jgi:hypothetical protein
MKRRSKLYQEAVEWIAHADEAAVTDAVAVANRLTVRLVADLYDARPHEVALDVVAVRLEDAVARQQAEGEGNHE